jgi:hypothetical protein
MIAVDQNQQKMVNEAAEKFAGAIKESYQALAQGGVNAYMDFLNSMFSYYQRNLDEAQKRARG